MTTLTSVIQRYEAAAGARDVDAMMALYSPTCRIFDMGTPWQKRSDTEWRPSLQGWMDDLAPGSGATAREIDLIETDGLGFVSALVSYFWLDDTGERQYMDNRLTWVLQPVGDDWQIIHEHTSVPWNETTSTVEWQQPPAADG